jgi:hypothetical protein
MGTKDISASQQEGINLINMNNLAIRYRGLVCHAFAELEIYIEQIITSYFCDTKLKRIELGHRLVGTKDLPFETKKKIVEFITVQHYSEFKTENPEIFKDLNFLMEYRNKVAHWKLHSTMEDIRNFNGTNVILATYKTEAHQIKIDKEVINDVAINTFITKLQITQLALGKLLNTIEANTPKESDNNPTQGHNEE